MLVFYKLTFKQKAFILLFVIAISMFLVVNLPSIYSPFIFVMCLTLAVLILRSCNNRRNSLELELEQKTKELEEINEYLRFKIQKEVEQNRKKDAIMTQQAKLASLGEMLNNIAHQWRQPLGSITMIIQSFQTKMALGKLTDEFVDKKVKDALLLANNMSQTLEDFKNFFSPNKEKNRFLVCDCIEHSIELSKYMLEKENIDVRVDGEKNMELNTYYNELSHVFLNLITNSKDALISRKKEKKYIHFLLSKEEGYAFIRAIDNGGGIPQEIALKIFEPYFTTKYKSAGTGIGLYMSKQIVEKHMRGRIEYESVVKEGEKCSQFSISIPLKDKDEI